MSPIFLHRRPEIKGEKISMWLPSRLQSGDGGERRGGRPGGADMGATQTTWREGPPPRAGAPPPGRGKGGAGRPGHAARRPQVKAESPPAKRSSRSSCSGQVVGDGVLRTPRPGCAPPAGVTVCTCTCVSHLCSVRTPHVTPGATSERFWGPTHLWWLVPLCPILKSSSHS